MGDTEPEGQTYIDGKATGQWNEADSELFLNMGAVFTPGREEIERALLDLVPAEEGEPFLAVEIGCGQGWLSEALLRRFPSCCVLALDGSQTMIEEARRLLTPYAGRVEFRPFRLEDPTWPAALPGPVRCFLSCLVLHHLDDAGKLDLFRRLYEALEPGGALLFADVAQPRNPMALRHAHAAWYEEVRRRSLELTGDERAYEFFVSDRWNIWELFRLKTLFGDRLSARRFKRQQTEVAIRCAALNRMTQLGMPDSYPVTAC